MKLLTTEDAKTVPIISSWPSYFTVNKKQKQFTLQVNHFLTDKLYDLSRNVFKTVLQFEDTMRLRNYQLSHMKHVD